VAQEKIRKLVNAGWSHMPTRFLIVGGFNFIFGYGIFALFWFLFGQAWPDWLIVLVTTVIGITESFLTHRFITYRSHGCWWREYFRFYVVYGFQTLANMASLRIFVTTLGLNAYVVQFVTLVLLTVATYWVHKIYSFKGNHT